jgi:hypothetical protein
MITIIVYILIAYLALFFLLVALGKQKHWTDGYGFRYSTTEWLDALCSNLFYPVYVSCKKVLGIQKLYPPLKDL